MGGKTGKMPWEDFLVRRDVNFIDLILLGALMAGVGTAARAQQAAGNESLSGSELRGKKVFLQRCSICHLPPLYRPASVKPYGPVLDGYLRNPQFEALARTAIREGTPRMPGFQYGLQASEIDDVIAYLKTLKAPPAAAKSEGGSNANTGRTGD